MLTKTKQDKMAKVKTLLERRLEVAKNPQATLDPIENKTADGQQAIVEPVEKEQEPMNKDILDQVNKKDEGLTMYQGPSSYNMSVPGKKIEYIQDSSLGVNSKGSAFPMVNQQQQPPMMPGQMPVPQPVANRAGQAKDRNVLSNDPNINQPENKVPYSDYKRNDRFSDIASNPGELYNKPPMQGEPSNPGELYNKPPLPQQKTFEPNQGFGMYDGPSNYSKNDAMVDQCMAPGMYDGPSKALVGGQSNLPDPLKKAIENSPGMYDGPSSYNMSVPAKKIEYIESFSKSPIAGYSKNMDHGHTKISKHNVKSSMRDDAAHASYLKRDIKYDAKHGGSNKQMTNDEKHISKLAGDIKYDAKKKRKYDNV